MFWVDLKLDLIQVAQSIAEDNTAQVASWLKSGELQRPTQEQVEDWDKTPARIFKSIVVQPYVLIQEISN